MINRLITSEITSTSKSILLLGPRQVGKSTLIQSLKPDLEINLADEMEYLKYSSRPEAFREKIEESNYKTIYVDEVQRLPKLLNTLQAIIDQNKKLKFYLNGSSARKLKHGQANLLPGRVLHFNLGPLASSELNYQMDSQRALEFGTLPEPYLNPSEKENRNLLRSYAGLYLKEEIKAESLVRNLESFARFFTEAVLQVANFVDYTKLSIKSKISRHAIPRYFEILEDTLVGYRIFPFSMANELDLIKHPKFYLFDNGVYNGLMGNFVASADRIGKLAEQLIFSQLKHSAWAKNIDIDLSTFRTRSGIEVDFIAKISGKLNAIEVNNSPHLDPSDLEGLKFFDASVSQKKNLFVFHFGKSEKRIANIWILPWQKGLKEIGL
jgi:predicted AAA+ superfamily ATPase